MKTTLLTAVLLFSLFASAQDLAIPTKVGVPLKDDQVHYELLDSAKATKEQIYTAFKASLVELFKAPGATVQMDDKDAGTLAGKSSLAFRFKLQMGVKGGGRAFFTYTLQAKDGRYRIQLTEWSGSLHDDAVEGQPILEVYTKGIYNSPKYREQYLTGFNEAAQAALYTFNQSIKKQLSNQDW